MTHRNRITALLLIAASALSAKTPFNYAIKPECFDRSVYREKTSHFRLLSSDHSFDLTATAHQRVLRRYLVKGRRAVIVATGLMREEPPGESNAAGHLTDTRYLAIHSPEIRKASERFRGSHDPVAEVERFVYGHISDKTIGIPLLPASEVYRTGRGDCTEHSVLAVAMLRSLGIPARAVVGVYLAQDFNGEKDVFVYHMWAEAYRNGRWRLTDATRPGEYATNRYIAFAYHSLRTEAPLPYLRAVSAIQDLAIRYCPGADPLKCE